MAAGCARKTAFRSFANSASDGRSSNLAFSIDPFSWTPKRIFASDQRRNTVKKEIIKPGRACRPISITSSKPAVVMSATRAPFLWSSALVPTVVPCSNVIAGSGADFVSASAMAREGSLGRRKNFQSLEVAGFDPHAVGESSARVDSHAQLGMGRTAHKQAHEQKRLARAAARELPSIVLRPCRNHDRMIDAELPYA